MILYQVKIAWQPYRVLHDFTVEELRLEWVPVAKCRSLQEAINYIENKERERKQSR